MSFTYKPLLKLLIDNNLKLTDLKGELGFGPSTIAKFRKDEYVSLEVVDRLCTYFKVQPNKIIEWKED